VPTPLKLSKADARRAMVRHHFATSPTIPDAFERLRSIQFDPIAPVGCNHDLVLQARVPGYKIGDWQKTAYEDRLIYDGWDKQASLVPFEGWPVRRIYHHWHRRHFGRIFDDNPAAVKAVLHEIETRGPLMPKDFEFQERKDDWRGSWHGPSLTKQTLRALWHSGMVMTTDRRKGQHVYDLTERILPPEILAAPPVEKSDAIRELVLERHRAVGILRPTAAWEVWSFGEMGPAKKNAIDELASQSRIVPIEVEGVKAHATPEFLTVLDQPDLETRLVFVAPLDPFVWDRKMIGHIFDFEYLWEIYVPEAKRRWGYYVLPVLFGNRLVGRVEFFARDGVLELRRWHSEAEAPGAGFKAEFRKSLRNFMRYCSATKIQVDAAVETKIRDLVLVPNAAG
jgi:uncharacterized protein